LHDALKRTLVVTRDSSLQRNKPQRYDGYVAHPVDSAVDVALYVSKHEQALQVD
jgi:hypothetical protein